MCVCVDSVSEIERNFSVITNTRFENPTNISLFYTICECIIYLFLLNNSPYFVERGEEFNLLRYHYTRMSASDKFSKGISEEKQ